MHMPLLCCRYPLQDRPGVSVALKNRAQGSICVGIEFINYAQAKQLEVTKGQVRRQGVLEVVAVEEAVNKCCLASSVWGVSSGATERW